MPNFSPETISTVKKLVPMDDVMFQKICEDKAVCQELISAILAEPVMVESVVSQDSILNLQGRSVRLDCLCRLSDGTYVNVEVQKADDDDHEARVWYNAALVTANETPKSVKFRDVAQVIVIYITRFDIFQGDLPIYHVDRAIRELEQKRTNWFSEIYVNAAVKKHDSELNASVSELMDLFTDRDTFNYEKYPLFSTRKNTFTNTAKGEAEMCEKVEALFETLMKKRELTNLFIYVQNGDMALQKAAKNAKLTPKEFKEQMQSQGYHVPVRAKKPAAVQ